MVRVAVVPVVLLAMLASAGAARAASAVIPADAAPIAVRFMGDSVVWAERAGRGELRLVRASTFGRRPRTLATLRAPGGGALERLRLAASRTRLAVSAHFAGQESIHRAGVPGDLRPIEPGWLDLHGNHLLTPTDDLKTLRILDPMGGAPVDVALPAEYPMGFTSAELAGTYIGYIQSCCGRLVDWRTGRTVLTLNSGDQAWISELEADGTALWGGSHSDSMSEIVGDGEGQLYGGLYPPQVLRMLGRGRLAYDDSARNEIVVTDLFGGRLAASPISRSAARATTDNPIGRFWDHGRLSDFDGARATWSSKPCLVALVTVWHVAGGPIGTGPRCPSARRAGRVRGTDLPLRCPGAVLTGCPTRLTVLRRGIRLARLRVDLAPGERRVVRLPLRGAPRRVTIVARPALHPARAQRRVWRVVAG